MCSSIKFMLTLNSDQGDLQSPKLFMNGASVAGTAKATYAQNLLGVYPLSTSYTNIRCRGGFNLELLLAYSMKGYLNIATYTPTQYNHVFCFIFRIEYEEYTTQF